MNVFSFSSILTLIGLVVADKRLHIDNAKFDSGDLGQYPTQEYKTTDIRGPHPNFVAEGGPCDSDGLYVFTTPRGSGVPNENCGPMITDEMGALVWLNSSYQQPYNLAVQEYKGEKYLTFWVGDDGVRGHGAGVYYMLNSSYDEVYKIKAAHGLAGDLHEFRITPQNTALITVYQTVQKDLSSVRGPKHGWIWECLFQELDIETGEALFEWRASDHVGFDQSYETRCVTCGRTQDSAWDWFHINSIDKDPQGNYIISSRYVHTVTHINGTTGEIIWILGGKSNMFKDLSGGAVTQFVSQHHARWRDDYTAITLFDNHNPASPNRPSTGLYIDLDFEEMTAKLRHSYSISSAESTYSQGSLQILDNGHVLLGYGYLGLYAEYTMEGEPLCNVHLEPKAFFGRGQVQSYRVGKYEWVGTPRWAPNITQVDGKIYMSWLGSTEVTHWRIEESNIQDGTDDDFSAVGILPKDGFETAVANCGVSKSYIRAVALDQKHNRLSATRAIKRGPAGDCSEVPQTKIARPLLITIISLTVSTIVALCVIIGFYIRSRLRYRSYQRAAARDAEKDDDDDIIDAEDFELEDADTLLEETSRMLDHEEHR